jgi:hypothetical protein
MWRWVGVVIVAITLTCCTPPAPAVKPAVDPPANSAFPVIKDRSTLSIKLERTVCFGFCPAYTVEISGDGLVRYCGDEFVKEQGLRTRTISIESVRLLTDLFARSDFFNLKNEYVGGVDAPFQILTLSFDGRSKQVVESIGEAAGMPASVPEIGKAIDDAAGSAEWIGDRNDFSRQDKTPGPMPKC